MNWLFQCVYSCSLYMYTSFCFSCCHFYNLFSIHKGLYTCIIITWCMDMKHMQLGWNKLLSKLDLRKVVEN
jgi:hypothetical protein